MNDSAIAAAPTTPVSVRQAQRSEFLQEELTKPFEEQKPAPVRKLEEQKKKKKKKKKRQVEVTRVKSECTKRQRQDSLGQHKEMLPQLQHKLRDQELSATVSVGRPPGAMLSSAPNTLLSPLLTGTISTAIVIATSATASMGLPPTPARYRTFKFPEQQKQRLTAQHAKLCDLHQKLIMAQHRTKTPALLAKLTQQTQRLVQLANKISHVLVQCKLVEEYEQTELKSPGVTGPMTHQPEQGQSQLSPGTSSGST